jgi:thioesterase domain-containing protein
VAASAEEEVAAVLGEELQSLTEELWEGIPLAAAAGIEVTEADEYHVRVSAPFHPNRNYHGTGFGGSIAIVGIVTGWISVSRLLHEVEDPHEVVIQASSVDYLEPARSDLQGRAPSPEPNEIERLLRTYRRFGRARISVTSTIESGDMVVAIHEGTYAALRI